jgi:hypothetical protein
MQRNLPRHCTYVINYSYSYPCSEYSINQSLTYVDRIYPTELETKDTTGTYTDRSALYLDLHMKIDNEGRLNKTLR